MISLYELEERYKDILESIEEWVYLRVALGHQLKNPNTTQIYKKTDRYTIFKKRVEKVKNIFYGFKNWFRQYDYICFSDSSQRRLISGEYKDKIMDDIVDRLDNSLLIELPNSSHYKNVFTKNITSQSFLDFISFLYKQVLFSKIILNKNLDEILSKNSIEFDYKSLIMSTLVEEKIYKILFSIYKPKVIFISCAYCRFGIVKAAKGLNIDVVELQHGVITEMHYGYVSKIKLDTSYIPNRLLSFGYNENNIKSLIIKNVIPIGSYYLDYLQSNFKPNKKLKSIVKNYKYTVGVSLQDADWEYEGMLSFIERVAKKDKDILYILIPRKRTDNLKTSKNIILFNSLDCYNIILHCNIHATLYSSCVLEAPTLGIPNIMIDLNCFASKYYENILSKYHTKIVDKEEKFIKAIYDMSQLEKKSIQLNNSKVFVSNYNKRINSFIKNI